MNASSDAAEQVVRLSLEGVEVVARISGSATKELALMLASAMKNQKASKGKTRLSKMLKSGKQLEVFSVKNKDLKKFTKEAARYGILFTVLKDKNNNSPEADVDILARAEDAAKFERIIKKFEMSTVSKAEVTVDGEKKNPDQALTERSHPSEQKSIEERSGRQRKYSVKKKLERFKEEAKDRKLDDITRAIRDVERSGR